MPEVKVPPVADPGVMTDVLPAGSPALMAPAPYVIVTLPIVSLFTKPDDVKDVEPEAGLDWVEPYVLLASLAVILSDLGNTLLLDADVEMFT